MRRIDWYSDLQSWDDFYNSNTWVMGDILVWHFGSPEQKRTFVWTHDNMKNEPPPEGKWLEISNQQ